MSSWMLPSVTYTMCINLSPEKFVKCVSSDTIMMAWSVAPLGNFAYFQPESRSKPGTHGTR
jgi:hypothetical protein